MPTEKTVSMVDEPLVVLSQSKPWTKDLKDCPCVTESEAAVSSFLNTLIHEKRNSDNACNSLLNQFSQDALCASSSRQLSL